jgi:hypothetical protein
MQDAVNAHTSIPVLQALDQLQQGLDGACKVPPLSLGDAIRVLDGLELRVNVAVDLVLAGQDAGQSTALQPWTLDLQAQCRDARAELLMWSASLGGQPCDNKKIPTLRELAESGNALALARLQEIASLAELAAAMARADYSLLYDSTRCLIAVGYNVDEHRRDTGHYDLLASEARLCSFVTIALGDVPQENWFALGRLLTSAGDDPTLLSWSGSMFEYLMPNLVMPVFVNSLLAQTSRAVVLRHIAYGEQHGVPWGISESGYNAVDTALNYQYRAFGVPGLGLKRGLADDLIIF